MGEKLEMQCKFEGIGKNVILMSEYIWASCFNLLQILVHNYPYSYICFYYINIINNYF